MNPFREADASEFSLDSLNLRDYIIDLWAKYAREKSITKILE